MRQVLKEYLVSTNNNANVDKLTQEDDVIKIWDVEFLFFDLILDRIIEFPPTDQLITKVNKKNDEFLVFVSSVETMRAGAPGYIVCIVNQDPRHEKIITPNRYQICGKKQLISRKDFA